MPARFEVPDDLLVLYDAGLSSADPTTRIAAVDRALAWLREHEQRLGVVRDLFRKRLSALDANRDLAVRESAAFREARADVVEALTQLERGPLGTEGTLPGVSPFVGLPGWRFTTARLQALERDRVFFVRLRDEGHIITPLRYIGTEPLRMGMPDGRQRNLKRGDIITHAPQSEAIWHPHLWQVVTSEESTS